MIPREVVAEALRILDKNDYRSMQEARRLLEKAMAKSGQDRIIETRQD